MCSFFTGLDQKAVKDPLVVLYPLSVEEYNHTPARQQSTLYQITLQKIEKQSTL